MSRITIYDAAFVLLSYGWGCTLVAAVVGVMALFSILARRRERRLRAELDAEMKQVANRLCHKI